MYGLKNNPFRRMIYYAREIGYEFLGVDEKEVVTFKAIRSNQVIHFRCLNDAGLFVWEMVKELYIKHTDPKETVLSSNERVLWNPQVLV